MFAAPRDDIGRAELADWQAQRLSYLLREILPANRFYARKFQNVADLASLTRGANATPLAELSRLPFTTKAELLDDQAQHPPYGEILTYPVERYNRLHQTSGTAGRPLRWLDTPESWSRLLDCWVTMFGMAGVTPADRLFFPFSFGPFLGFWTAFEAASRLGCLCLPGGGLSSSARLRFLLDNEATVVLCTPTYALRLAEVARSEGIDLVASPVRKIIVAGEPGGSITATRQRIESAWGARLFDHTGMTETGPLGIECSEHPGGLHLLETECLVEVIDPATEQPAPIGTEGELVLTTFDRPGSPLVRYRTGDLVRIDPQPCPCGRELVRLDGGIRGRVDDMIVVRGNNLHPSALQTILHRFSEVAEYRVEVDRTAALPVLRIEVEPQPEVADDALAERVEHAIRTELLFRAEVRAVPPGSLPRFEMKARRLVRKIDDGTASGTRNR
ncbi:MAG TPA: AMP-binding protein [Gemmataceae bacterium]|nr:AMP-binding protein [Gemmataceae bacterium]